MAIQLIECNLTVTKHAFAEHLLTLAHDVLAHQELNLPSPLLEPLTMASFLLSVSRDLRD